MHLWLDYASKLSLGMLLLSLAHFSERRRTQQSSRELRVLVV